MGGEPEPSPSGACELRLEASARQHFGHCGGHSGSCLVSTMRRSRQRATGAGAALQLLDAAMLLGEPKPDSSTPCRQQLRIVSAKRCAVSPRPSATAAAHHLFKVCRMAVQALHIADRGCVEVCGCLEQDIVPAKNEVVVGAPRRFALTYSWPE